MDHVERIAYPLVEAAHLVGVSRTRIFDAARKRELTVRKAGRVSLVTRDDLLAWIKTLPVRGCLG
jgi:excisionase family DNA binding protein